MKKKGFTLIELLAVIIILAVIALITTPIVLNIIDNAKKEADKASANGIVDAAKLYYAEMYLDGKGSVSNYECTFSEGSGCIELTLTGTLPKSGTITIDNKGMINGKLSFEKNIFYICNNNVKETLDSTCSYTDYENIYAINNEGVITGFKTKEETAYIELIPVVSAAELTDEASAHLQTQEITIPEYVGSIEVRGIASNAFSSYDITKVTILSNKAITVNENALPTNLEKLIVKSCFTNGYSEYSDILEIIETDCKLYDSEAPVFQPMQDITVNVGETVDLTSGVVVTDNVGLEGTYTYSPESIDTSVVGETIVTYKAIDKAGNETIVTRKVIVEKKVICKRADIKTLHTETCNQTASGYYCSGKGGYTKGSTITYGNKTVTQGKLTTGDAFDCDVNGDKIFNPQTERFYYVTDLKNNSKYAVLIYYNNTTKGVSNNTSSSLIAYNSNGTNYNGPVTAITNLPTTTQWSNISLSSTSRAITTDTGTTSTSGGTLPTAFSYTKIVDGKTVPLAARLLTDQEYRLACTSAKICEYLVENTQYSDSTLGTDGFWFETPRVSESGRVYRMSGERFAPFWNGGTSNASRNDISGVRPVIEVSKDDMQY